MAEPVSIVTRCPHGEVEHRPSGSRSLDAAARWWRGLGATHRGVRVCRCPGRAITVQGPVRLTLRATVGAPSSAPAQEG